MTNMNNFCIKPHKNEGEDSFTFPSSESSISVTKTFWNDQKLSIL